MAWISILRILFLYFLFIHVFQMKLMELASLKAVQESFFLSFEFYTCCINNWQISSFFDLQLEKVLQGWKQVTNQRCQTDLQPFDDLS